MTNRAYLSWSSGKDAAQALLEIRHSEDIEVGGVLTTITEGYDRVTLHGVRLAVLDLQIASLGLPSLRVSLPKNCTMEDYDSRMIKALEILKSQGISHIVYGDIFIESLRVQREEQLSRVGMKGIFPLWRQETTGLSSKILNNDFMAYVSCVNLSRLDQSFVGRPYDRNFVNSLPPGVDPCGENGEFHTVLSSGPVFTTRIPLKLGEIVVRDGFAFADFIPAT